MSKEMIVQIANDFNNVMLTTAKPYQEQIKQLQAKIKELSEQRERGMAAIDRHRCSLLAENKKLQKQSDLLTLGLLQEKDKVQKLINALDCAKNFIDGYGAARIKEGLGRDGMDAVLNVIDEIAELTDICPICGEEKPISDLHRNCGK